MDLLSDNQQYERLEQLEQIIEPGLATFAEVALAFLEIRDRKLFRLDNETKTFEEYCQKRWSFALSTGQQYAKAGEVLKQLSDGGIANGEMPRNISQAYALASVPTDSRLDVWNSLSTSEKPITGKMINEEAKLAKLKGSPDWIIRAYQDDKVTITTANKLSKVYTSSPKSVQAICDLYGYEWDNVITELAIASLCALHQEMPQLLNEVYVTNGYITIGNGEQVHISNLESSMIEDLLYTQRLESHIKRKEKKQEDVLNGIKSVQECSPIVVDGIFGLSEYTDSDLIKDGNLLCAFPSEPNETETIVKRLKGYGFNVSFIVATRGDIPVNMDGTRVLSSDLSKRSTKPKWLLDMLKNMVWGKK